MNAPLAQNLENAPEKHPLAHTFTKQGKPRKDVVTVQGFEESGMRLKVERTSHDGQVAEVPLDPRLQSRMSSDAIIAFAGGGKYEWEIRSVHNQLVDQGTFDAGLPSIPLERLGTITAEAYARELASGGGGFGPPAQSMPLGADGVAIIPKGSKPEEVTAIVRETREHAQQARIATANAVSGGNVFAQAMPLIEKLVGNKPESFGVLEQVRQVLLTSDEQVRGAGRREDGILDQLRAANMNADSRVMKAEEAAREREVALRDLLREALNDDRAEISARAQFWKKVAQDADDRTKRIEELKDAKIKTLEEDYRAATIENIRLERAQRSGEVAAQIVDRLTPLATRAMDRWAPAPGGSNGSAPLGLPSGLEGFAEFLPLIQRHPVAWIAVVRAVSESIEQIAAHPQGPEFYTELLPAFLANVPEYQAAIAEQRHRATAPSHGTIRVPPASP